MRDVERRLEDLEDELGSDDEETIDMLVFYAVEDDPKGRAPGFYWDDRPGCRIADLVYDPAAGEPTVPRKYRRYMADSCMTVVYGQSVILPPLDEMTAPQG